MDDVGMLRGRCVHTFTGKSDIFRHISRRSHSTLSGFQNAVQILWHQKFGVTGA